MTMSGEAISNINLKGNVISKTSDNRDLLEQTHKLRNLRMTLKPYITFMQIFGIFFSPDNDRSDNNMMFIGPTSNFWKVYCLIYSILLWFFAIFNICFLCWISFFNVSFENLSVPTVCCFWTLKNAISASTFYISCYRGRLLRLFSIVWDRNLILSRRANGIKYLKKMQIVIICVNCICCGLNVVGEYQPIFCLF